MLKRRKNLIFILGILALCFLPFNATRAGDVSFPNIPTNCMVRVNLQEALEVEGCPMGPCIYEDNRQCGICCLLSTIVYITNWVFVFLLTLTVALVLFGAFNIITAAGDANKLKKGKDFILWAAIGLGVALMSRAVPYAVRFFIE